MTWLVKIERLGVTRWLGHGIEVELKDATRFMSEANALFLARQYQREKRDSGRAVTCSVIEAESEAARG